jgi:hypothetical protein
MKQRDPVREALQQVRDVSPSPELEARVMRALVEAEREETALARKKDQRRSTWLSHFRLTLPALASMAIAAHLALVDPTQEDALFKEHMLELPDVGHGALPLLLSLDEHDSEFASVRLDVPHGVRVSPSNQAFSASEPSCHSEGCIYEFLHPTGSEEPHLEVHVDEPGRYRVEVEHASDSKRLREIIVVHASR